MDQIANLVKAIPDFPMPGVIFRDLTPLLLEPGALKKVVDRFVAAFAAGGVDVVVGVESRGFIFGAPVAMALGCAFVPVRKLGKLPRATVSRAYALEYGRNHLEMHSDAVRPGDRVLLVDDVLATGGTARAAAEIVEELGGTLVGAAFVIELLELRGRQRLPDREVLSLLTY